jgi:hypothetical protein
MGSRNEASEQGTVAVLGRKFTDWLNNVIEFRATPPFWILGENGLHVDDHQPGSSVPGDSVMDGVLGFVSFV